MNRILLMIILLLPASGVVRAQQEKLLGDGNDGNRSMPVHLVELLDEDGRRIRSTDVAPKPFSTQQTCGKCHDYGKISQGWHFSGHDSDVPAGRPSQPWMLSDARTRTQLPISGRGWTGTFTPEQVGLTAWDFVLRFGSHHPGGSYATMDPTEPEHALRQNISGQYEINCLACHSADPKYDASLAALQVARQNYRWAAAAASGKAVVTGTASALSDFFDPEFDEGGIETTYADGVFDKDQMVFFDIAGKPQDRQCYFCHSYQDLRVDESLEWRRDLDVHSAAGIGCTDCHRNGVDHKLSRGEETADGYLASLSCKGCHLGVADELTPQGGRLGAPVPRHAGIPPIHFEKMNCTACHSGTWPEESVGRWRTARIHKLGLHGLHKVDLRLPHVYAPVLLKGDDGKIGPHYLVWPAFWAILDGDDVTPIPPANVLATARSILAVEVEREDDWRPLTEEQVAEVLGLLAVGRQGDGTVVYISGGKLYQQTDTGDLVVGDHPAAAPYAWPLAHDVRPAAQSLGVRSCADCHTTDSPFFFAGVEMDTPIQGDKQFVQMVELQGISRFYMWAFNASFVFRPMLKVVAFAACGLIGLALLIYGLKALVVISRACAQEAQ